MSGKWTSVVTCYLSRRKHGFFELQILIRDVSPKMSSDILEHLVRYGFVGRVVEDGRPSGVYYYLTEKGNDFTPILVGMEKMSIEMG